MTTSHSLCDICVRTDGFLRNSAEIGCLDVSQLQVGSAIQAEESDWFLLAGLQNHPDGVVAERANRQGLPSAPMMSLTCLPRGMT